MQHRWIALVTALTLGVIVVRVSGHHSFSAEFDANQPVTIRGVISKVEWVNPHSWIYVDVKQSDGTVVTWAIEGTEPNALIRRGLRKDSMPIGAEIVVQGWRAKNGKNMANGGSVTLPGGK